MVSFANPSPLLAFIELHLRRSPPAAMWDNLHSLVFLVENENFVPHRIGKDVSSSTKYKCKRGTTDMEVPSSAKYKCKLTTVARSFCIAWFSLWKLKILTLGFLCGNWKFCPTSSGKGRFKLYKIQMQACSIDYPQGGGKEASSFAKCECKLTNIDGLCAYYVFTFLKLIVLKKM